MKKHNKILRTCLTLAIIGTTLAPIASAVNHSKPCAGQKRPSSAASAKAGKPVRKKIRVTEYSSPKFLRQFIVKEQQRRQQKGLRFAPYRKNDPQEECAVNTMTAEDRERIYNLVMSYKSTRYILASPCECKELSDQDKLCMNYLKRKLDFIIIYVPECYWPGMIKHYFSDVFSEKTDEVVSKVYSCLEKKLDESVPDYTSYEKICNKIMNELKLFPIPADKSETA